jgi:NitT/TauT family transport system substrate-binding protein
MALLHAKKWVPVALAVVVGLALSACSSNDSNGSTTSAGKLQTVTVGVQPNTAFAVVPFGVKQGFFEQEGLDVKIKTIATATTIPPALVSGQLQFSNWSFPSFATLAGQGLPLKIIGAGDTTGTSLKDDYIQLLTLKKSGITTIEQLKGKTVAVNSLASLTEVQIRALLDKAGMAQDSVKLVPIPFPDQLAALSAGRVDAIGSAEPFLSLAMSEEDVNQVAPLDAAIMPNMPLSLWMTSDKFLKSDPSAVRKFQLALIKSLAYAKANPDKFRAFVPGFSGVKAEVAQNMILPTWVSSIDAGKAQDLAQIMNKYGAVDSVPDMSKFIAEFPLPKS